MIQKLIDKGFGVSVWKNKEGDLFVAIQYKHKRVVREYSPDLTLNDAVSRAAISLSNTYPELINIDDFK